MQSLTPRHLPWDGSFNIRDVGGYPATGGRETRWKALVRADNLYRLSEQARTALVDYGIRTVIDLRMPYELAMAPSPFAEHGPDSPLLTYISSPLAHGVSKDLVTLVHRTQDLSESYRLMLRHYRSGIAASINAFADARPGGVLVHCHAGKDRTGLVVAMLLGLAGVPLDTIVADYVLSDEYLQPLYAEWLQAIEQPDARAQLLWQLQSRPETISQALAFLDEHYGGIQDYLRGAGVSDEAVSRIQRRLHT